MTKIRTLRSARRILLKLSGEILSGDQPFGIHPTACTELSRAILALYEQGMEVGIVMGGGNIFRGNVLTGMGIPQTPADQVGMLATLINGITLQQSLDHIQCPSKLLSALECPRVAETYTWSAAQKYLEQKNVLIFAGGTGNPYFTTDTAAALRASEIGATVLIKATKVDGIYTNDPIRYTDATRYDQIPYSQVIADNLQIMDQTAVIMCAKNKIPIFVCNMNLLRAEKIPDLLDQQIVGTWVTE